MLREIGPVTGFDHSLFGLYKRTSLSLPDPFVLGRLLSIYLAVSSLFGVVIVWFRIRKLPIINQILSLSVASILFPPTSFDYTLMHLYIPWTLLVLLSVRSRLETSRRRGLSLVFVCFAILMSPESEFIHNGLRFGGQIKAVTLVLLLAVSLIFPFRREEETELPGGVMLRATGGVWMEHARIRFGPKDAVSYSLPDLVQERGISVSKESVLSEVLAIMTRLIPKA